MAGIPVFSSGGASTTQQIPTYENPDTEIKGNPAGAEAAGQAARRIGYLTREGGEAIEKGARAAGSATAEILEHKQQLLGNQELTKAWATHSEAVASLHDQYDQMRMNLTDPNKIADLQGQFLQKYKDAGAEFTNSLETPFAKKHGEEMVRSHYDEFLRQVRSDNAEFASIAVKTNVEKSLTSLGSTVFQNPTMLPWAIENTRSTIEKLYGNLPGGAGAKTLAEREEFTQKSIENLVLRAGEGVIRKGGSPSALMEKYGQFVKDPDVLVTKFEAEKRAERSDLMMQKSLRDMDRRDASDKAQLEASNKIADAIKGGGRIDGDFMQGVLRDPRLSESARQSIDNFAFNTQMKLDKQTEQRTFNDYAQKAIEGGVTDTTLLQALSNPDPAKHLDIEHANQIRNFLNGPEKMNDADKMGFQALKERLTDTLNPRDTPTPEGAGAYEGAINLALQKWSIGVRAGKDRNELLNPDSKDYILRGVNVEQFKAKPGDVLGSTALKTYVTEQQSSFKKVVDDAVGITNIVKQLGPEQANVYLHDHGYNLDVNGPWCAKLVNSVLERYGLPSTGSALASSFKTWGFSVPAADAKAGDVFYSASGTSEGYTGHVGFLTGNQKTEDGKLMLEVVSSHVKGAATNSGGIEWRSAAELQIHRAQPPVSSIFSAGDLARGIGATFSGYLKNPSNYKGFKPTTRGEPQGEIE